MLREVLALDAVASFVGLAGGQDLPGPKIEWPKVKGLDRQKPSIFKHKAQGKKLK
jgi:hypothetical protein